MGSVVPAGLGDPPQRRAGKPVTTQALIGEHLSGLVCDHDMLVLLGPTSELGWAATQRRDDLAHAVLRAWRRWSTPTTSSSK